MKFEILTIFPDFFRGPLDYGIVRKAREAGLIDIGIHDLRGFTQDRHRTVDDRPFGGGEGMVLKPEPIFECLEAMGVSPREDRLRNDASEAVVLLSPQGRLFTQAVAQELVGRERVVMICGRYEGVDERVSEFLADREISVGDFVLSGGELGAAIVVDTVSRLIPGALGNAASAQQESFTTPTAVSTTLANRRQMWTTLRRMRGTQKGMSLLRQRADRADCWIIRTTRALRSFGGCRFPRC